MVFAYRKLLLAQWDRLKMKLVLRLDTCVLILLRNRGAFVRFSENFKTKDLIFFRLKNFREKSAQNLCIDDITL